MATITLPNNIQNTDVSDADKVMGNLNAIVTEYNDTVGSASGDLVDTASTQILAGKTLTKPTLNGSAQGVSLHTPEASTTEALNLGLSNVHSVTMPAGDLTLSISNATVGQYFSVEINNVTSQGALTWFTTIRWVGGTAPTLTGTNGKRDSFMFRVTGTGTYDGYIVGMSI